MEDDAPVIYGLEFQARTLAAQVAETEAVKFFVGTQSLRYENQVHQLQFDEEHNLINKNVFLHKAGEVWHLSTSPTDPDVIATCYNQITPEGKCESGCSLWRLPATVQGSDSSPTDDNISLPALEQITKFESQGHGSDVKSAIWQPSEGKQMLTLLDNEVLYWDIADSSQAQLVGSMKGDPKGKLKFASARWNPHQSCTSLGTAIDNSVKGWDLRSMQSAWCIENAHSQTVREIDFNPNRQYYLATCADDCQAKFWDIRNPSKSVLTLSHHSHWIWSIRYNHFHDQLLLTCSSDSRVILCRVASISSEPFGHLLEEEEGLSSLDNGTERTVQQDGVITTYEEHEDSVYAVEWSSADPWLFASLSYDGRLVINKVPRAEKYKILL